ncbi:MAG: hypothetical protein AMS21_00670 [Gemmatimonas sp. SG8_38_2]|nr:MAG: hypothetical protein AMS21_00670 [Gemmatimonas sp. SG8_38_2]
MMATAIIAIFVAIVAYQIGYGNGWNNGFDMASSTCKRTILKNCLEMAKKTHTDLFDATKAVDKLMEEVKKER